MPVIPILGATSCLFFIYCYSLIMKDKGWITELTYNRILCVLFLISSIIMCVIDFFTFTWIRRLFTVI